MHVYRTRKAVVVGSTLNTATLKIQGGTRQTIKTGMFDFLLGDICQVSIDSRTGKIVKAIKEDTYCLEEIHEACESDIDIDDVSEWE
jgi:hypothetical protein